MGPLAGQRDPCEHNTNLSRLPPVETHITQTPDLSTAQSSGGLSTPAVTENWRCGGVLTDQGQSLSIVLELMATG